MKLQLGYGSVGHSPVREILMLSLIPAVIAAQGLSAPTSPKDVVQAYRKMDSDGKRLTKSGWNRACRFFVKPGRPPQCNIMTVTEGDAIEENPRLHGNRATVWLRCSAVGQIDASGRFTSVVAPALRDCSEHAAEQSATLAMRGPVPVAWSYHLVLTDTHWEFVPGSTELHEVKGPPEWRIEDFDFRQLVTIEAAIRYLTQLREKSGGDIIKQNAEKSVAALRRVQRRPPPYRSTRASEHR